MPLLIEEVIRIQNWHTDCLETEDRFRFGTPKLANMHTISLSINGSPVTVEIPANRLLVDLLREDLRLTGTHIGCDTSQCGACVVLVNDKSLKSCTMLAVQAAGGSVVTIEGLAKGAELHPMQVAFRENHALQCGFCTPGMVLTGIALAKRNPDPKPGEVRAWLEGNFCRCTGYHNIVKAISAGARAMSAAEQKSDSA